MKTVSRQALVPFSAMQMFELVDDIEKYPEFLPNCKGAQELERSELTVVARLEVAKGSFEKSFTTRNSNTLGQRIDMVLVDGPFKHLTGSWIFTELNEQASKVELNIEFEFSNILTTMAFGAVFHQMAESFVEAFSLRAREVYGR